MHSLRRIDALEVRVDDDASHRSITLAVAASKLLRDCGGDRLVLVREFCSDAGKRHRTTLRSSRQLVRYAMVRLSSKSYSVRKTNNRPDGAVIVKLRTSAVVTGANSTDSLIRRSRVTIQDGPSCSLGQIRDCAGGAFLYCGRCDK